MTSQPLTKIAICYDFDGTLSPCDMQESALFPKLGIKPKDFWQMVRDDSKQNDMDSVLANMNIIVREARKRNLSITRADLQSYGANVPLFKGVLEWFSITNDYASSKNVELEHYIISSGIEEMIEGTPISKEFKKIFACRFIYEDNQAASPAAAVNYTNKTQFLFRINKGILNYYENKKLNQYTPKEEKIIPFSNIIYIGDGQTDVPCMKMVMGQGGTAIAIYNPAKESDRQSVIDLIKHNRADYMAEADYTEESSLLKIIKSLINKIEAQTQCDLIKEQVYKEIDF